eukprot:507557-Pleurochrysis_carterae.AAC.2
MQELASSDKLVLESTGKAAHCPAPCSICVPSRHFAEDAEAQERFRRKRARRDSIVRYDDFFDVEWNFSTCVAQKQS